ncbi:DUF308 domain-containing protein [Devosia nitrariae]|uniref:Acid-resistance membrane protein n=1 Tax=Devosia nitrariae TaxID=2071872 RepID=A0ABQ5VYJ3_9HYPH|nr:DUF308 domain-containing protein [Devosia nitrariae]GLQ52869.1 hypothetical protein GCM10010862_01270 [Devosia nitrariae]
MAVSQRTMKNYAWAMGLRGLLMLLAGLYALIFPGPALAALVVVGGILLIIDSVLGLWSLTFGGGKSGNYWFDVISNVISLILGILILLSPFLATLLTVTFLVYLAAIAAAVVGAMQIWFVVRERESYARIWPVLLSGVFYVLFGIVLALFPLMSAEVLMMFGGILMIIFSFGLFGWAWRLWQRAKDAP